MNVKRDFLIGCGSIILVVFGIFVLICIWLLTGPEGDVRLSNEMERYASEYLSEHEILDSSEDLLAYYDATVRLNGTKAAILTSERIMYHKNETTNAVILKDITEIRHRRESIIGDIIEIDTATGKFFKIEIAPFNQGETFKNVLMSAWEKTKKKKQE